jgi:hypothetical protein
VATSKDFQWTPRMTVLSVALGLFLMIAQTGSTLWAWMKSPVIFQQRMVVLEDGMKENATAHGDIQKDLKLVQKEIGCVNGQLQYIRGQMEIVITQGNKTVWTKPELLERK